MADYFVHFDVVGHPEPAGSKRAFSRGGRIVVVDDNPKSKRWKAVVASTARGAMLRERRRAFDGPVWIEMVFRRRRPVAHVKANGELSLEGRRHEYPATKPDALKLARAVEDAMTGVVYGDDAQIVSEVLRKEWGEEEGVSVTVMEL